MKEKKKIILIISILFFICVISIFLCKIISDNKKMKVFDKVERKILNHDDILIYLTNNDSKCYLCDNANYIFKYYEDMYQLDIIHVNKNQIHNKEYETIVKYIDERENYLKEPALVLIKNGREVAVANEISSEKEVQRLLTDYDFIDLEREMKLQIDNSLFHELYQKEELSLILFQSYTDIGIKARKEIFKLSQQYHFDYFIMTDLMMDDDSGYRKIYDILGKELIVPFFVVMGGNQVMDTYEFSNNEKGDLKEFLVKNNFIY